MPPQYKLFKYLSLEMVLLVEKLSCFSLKHSKLENHQSSKALSASLHTFESDISKALIELSLKQRPRSEFLSLQWICRCLQFLHTQNRALLKLMEDIEYPMNIWEMASTEEYLQYSLELLKLFNSITSSVSHLDQARVSLSHALNLMENSPVIAMERLKVIRPRSFNKNCRGLEEKKVKGENGFSSGKERVIHEALIVMKITGFWVCAIVGSSLCGDLQSGLEMKMEGSEIVNSPLMSLNLNVCEEMREIGGLLKEVREVNDGVARVFGATKCEERREMAEDLKGKVEVFGKLLEGVGKEVDLLFSQILMGRNEMLNTYQQRKP